MSQLYVATSLDTVASKFEEIEGSIPTVPTSEISANTAARHSHSNKSILDGITQTPLYEHQSLANYVQTTDSRLSDSRTPTVHTHTKSEITDFPEIPTVPTSEISANTSARHNHSNKSVLDGITSEKVSAWDSNNGGSLTYDSTTETITWDSDGTSTSASGGLRGKTILSFGDSIMYGAGYSGGITKVIADKYGTTSINEAVNGATLAKDVADDEGGVRSCIYTQVSTSSNYTNANFIILDGGLNDAWANVELGSITSDYTDTFDDTTTLGGLEKLLRYLRLNHSDKKILYVFPHGGMLPMNHLWYSTYKPKIKQALNKWGVLYVDIQATAPFIGNYGLTDLNTSYLADTTHPNQNGYEVFYRDAIASALTNYYSTGVVATVGSSGSSETPTTEVIVSDYSPSGTTFSYARSVDWDNGEYIEAKFDVSSCVTASGENVFAVGNNIVSWGGNNIQMYYIKNIDRILIQMVDSNNNYGQTMYDGVRSAPITIKIMKGHIIINGTDDPWVAYGASDTITSVWDAILASNTITIGSLNSEVPSNATYEYIKIVR